MTTTTAAGSSLEELQAVRDRLHGQVEEHRQERAREAQALAGLEEAVAEAALSDGGAGTSKARGDLQAAHGRIAGIDATIGVLERRLAEVDAQLREAGRVAARERAQASHERVVAEALEAAEEYRAAVATAVEKIRAVSGGLAKARARLDAAQKAWQDDVVVLERHGVVVGDAPRLLNDIVVEHRESGGDDAVMRVLLQARTPAQAQQALGAAVVPEPRRGSVY
ncbi:MAG: hypothetical protein ACTHQ3_12775 [Motilibacteraceae bacterium]